MTGKTIIRLLVGAALACACQDNSYRGYEFSAELFNHSEPVSVAVGSPRNMSKGTGPVDELEDFAGKEVHVWAFNRDTVNYLVDRQTDSLVCLLDGAPAYLTGVSSYARWRGGRKYYYPNRENTTARFDFFAAFLDLEGGDIDPANVERYPDSVRVRMKIDGSQDIMVSKAGLPIEIGGDYKDYAFSYLSAEEGDFPIFTMNHTLVKVDLVVRPGITPGKHSRVRVMSASLESLTDATITVASTDSSKLGTRFLNSNRGDLLLTEEGGEPLVPYTMTIIDGDPDDDEPGGAQYQQTAATHKIGAGFFVAPDTEYILRITLFEPDHDGDGGYEQREPVDNKIALARGGGFLPGHRYVVTMTIYGDRDVYTKITLVPWDASGSFILDPDAASELEEPNPGQQ